MKFFNKGYKINTHCFHVINKLVKFPSRPNIRNIATISVFQVAYFAICYSNEKYY